MADRTADRIGREEDLDHWLLPKAMATNVGGLIGSVVVGGVVITYTQIIMKMPGLTP